MKPTLLYDPAPRTTHDIFDAARYEQFCSEFNVIERTVQDSAQFYKEHLPGAMFVVGQPALNNELLASATSLKAIINVEGNFLQNLDYDFCFRHRIHVLSVSPVFAQPVAELALGLTLSLARDIPDAHTRFANGEEQYGLEGNHAAKLLNRCNLGFIGFGDLGRAILQVFQGFSPNVRIYDPWLSEAVLAREGLTSTTLDDVLQHSDVVMMVATVTEQSAKLMSAEHFAKMKQRGLFLLMSRAEVVDFDAMLDACASGHIKAATDVFPNEPLALDHPARSTPNLLLSAHRAGALFSALHEIGERTLADLRLMAKGLPPQNCKRAEAELVTRVQSKPIDKS